MKLQHLLFIIPFVLISCGGTKSITNRADIRKESSKKVLKKHSNSKFNQNTLSANLKVNLKVSGKSQGMNVKLRLEKDKTIWLSGSVFGFSIAKAIITPDRVSYYVKINKTYFDGDFSVINRLLGVELDFNMLQNLLLGDALFEMKAKNYDSKIDQQAHLLTPIQGNELADLLFWIHPINYKIEKQEIRAFEKHRFLSVEYKNYSEIEETFIPGTVEIVAKDSKNNAVIQLDYKAVKLNENLSFPYKIPSGYKRIKK
ncbi:DUF4292 domain-containing protein [Flavicella sp.]|uniref:DUF4292 domain-containing protein n=1 Tax=Flavicella sp. TaxID=2957742 RepID=UPI00301B536D